MDRYEINDAAADWSMAEAQVSKLASGDASGKSTVVSVKSTVVAAKKRKANEEDGQTEKKAGARRSMKKAKR